jgi:hypothetical protein
VLRSGPRLALVALVLAVVLPSGGPAGSQDGASGYDFYSLRSIGDGVTVDFRLIGFLPIEDLVGLSSVTSEAHYGVGRSDALAALPDPGDLILTLPGTLSALVGVSGLPDYPAAATASYPSTPSDVVQIVPDADLGAGRLSTEATETGAKAEAFVGHQVDTIGLLPSFSVGTIRTSATARQLGPATFQATATTEVSDLRLLGGLLRIGHITSTVSVGVINDKPTADAPQVDVSGVTVAGTPVGITSDGIVGLGQAVALAPVVDALVQPLVEQGISVRTTPATRTVGDRTASVSGGALEIEVPLDVQGYPGTLVVSFGRASADLEVGPLADAGGDLASDDGSSLPLDSGSFPGLGDSSGLDLGSSGAGSSGAGSGDGTGTELVAVPVGRQVEDWDVDDLYLVMLLGGVALFVAGRVVVRTSLRPIRRATDLRQLWRW